MLQSSAQANTFGTQLLVYTPTGLQSRVRNILGNTIRLVSRLESWFDVKLFLFTENRDNDKLIIQYFNLLFVWNGCSQTTLLLIAFSLHNWELISHEFVLIIIMIKSMISELILANSLPLLPLLLQRVLAAELLPMANQSCCAVNIFYTLIDTFGLK